MFGHNACKPRRRAEELTGTGVKSDPMAEFGITANRDALLRSYSAPRTAPLSIKASRLSIKNDRHWPTVRLHPILSDRHPMGWYFGDEDTRSDNYRWYRRCIAGLCMRYGPEETKTME